MKNEFDFPMIPAITPPKQHNIAPAPEPTEKRGSRMLCDFDYQLIEKIKDYAYGHDVAPKNRSSINERFVLKLNLNHNMNHEKKIYRRTNH